jgi:hypothetical protein
MVSKWPSRFRKEGWDGLQSGARPAAFDLRGIWVMSSGESSAPIG